MLFMRGSNQLGGTDWNFRRTVSQFRSVATASVRFSGRPPSVAGLLAAATPSWLCVCHRAINYQLVYPHPLAFSVDHDLPVRSRPDLALSPANFRRALALQHEQGRPPRQYDDLDVGIPSEDW